ncbi:DUF2927 domain-containing protein [Indioceanicola profundi]|uniref:DUF2927 domain-containing protein n=1 Tax=Indioceanicola profundi TaxID=2220096 RepID=UPI0013C49EB6|nr:DUF2927 domain-containing protein [Indioceanicola profundi]
MRLPRFLVRCAGLAALFLAMSGIAPALAQREVYTWPEPVAADDVWEMRLAHIFDDGILFDENKRERVLTRWTKPIRVVVRGDAAGDFLEHVDLVAADLSEASGIEIRVEVATLNRGDIELMLTWRKQYWPFFVSPVNPDDRAFTCIALPVSREGRMVRSDIHINAGNTGDAVARACILEELLQSFGLFGEVEDISTALNDHVGYQRLGDADRILVRTLYDERLTPGLTREEALALMPPILREKLTAR